ncbi:MAG: hypothetical protein Ct9H300mP11_23830 [Chloroflexota bacterium]|nr:MAG: hypothetical protein Ct9H300mP11_23830 [Chloroflexota bacterium]
MPRPSQLFIISTPSRSTGTKAAPNRCSPALFSYRARTANMFAAGEPVAKVFVPLKSHPPSTFVAKVLDVRIWRRALN